MSGKQKRRVRFDRLRKLTYSGEFTAAIANEVAKTTKLEELNITIERKKLLELGKSVHNHPSIKKLSVEGIGPSGFKYDHKYDMKGFMLWNHKKKQFVTDFLHFTLSGTSITILHLDSIIYPEWHFEVLGTYLSASWCPLKELHIRNFRELDSDRVYKFHKLVDGLFFNKTLTTLTLQSECMYLADKEIKAFRRLFEMNTTITKFHFDFYQVCIYDNNEDNTVRLYPKFLEALRCNSNVTDLFLSGFGNYLGRQYPEILFSDHLQSLELREVIVSKKYRETHLKNYRSLSDWIVRSQVLTSLALDIKKIDEESVRMLADAMSKNPVLKSLTLDFTDQEALIPVLVNGLTHNTNLTELLLHSESEDPEIVKCIALAQSIIDRNRTLNTSLFDRLVYAADDLQDTDYDENGNHKSRKHLLSRKDDTPSKRLHAQ